MAHISRGCSPYQPAYQHPVRLQFSKPDRKGLHHTTKASQKMCLFLSVFAKQCEHTVHWFAYCSRAVSDSKKEDRSDAKICVSPTWKGHFPADMHCSQTCCVRTVESSSNPEIERMACGFACKLLGEQLPNDVLKDFTDYWTEMKAHLIEDKDDNVIYLSDQYEELMIARASAGSTGFTEARPFVTQNATAEKITRSEQLAILLSTDKSSKISNQQPEHFPGYPRNWAVVKEWPWERENDALDHDFDKATEMGPPPGI